MDVWVIYTKCMYEKKFKNGTLNNLTDYAKERHNMNLAILSDHLFTILCDGVKNKVFYNKKEIIKFPKIVFLKKYDLYLARQFESLGIKVLNSSESMSTSRNKLKTYQVLTENGIKIPKSIYISSGVKRRDFTYVDVVNLLGNSKFVIKPSFGSKGKNICLINNEIEFNQVLENFTGICIFQEYIDISKGYDFRSYVLNGKYQGSAIRVNETDFRANYSLGAKIYRLQEKDEKLIEIAEKTAKAIGLWSCAVDILKDDKNFYVCEVNSIPGKTRKINTNKRLINRLKEILDTINKENE